MANAGSFKKGEKRPRQGKRGPGKATAELKDMILEALSNAGGVKYLTTQAEENPKAFLPLLGRVLPLQVSGADGGPLIVEVIKFDGAGSRTQ